MFLPISDFSKRGGGVNTVMGRDTSNKMACGGIHLSTIDRSPSMFNRLFIIREESKMRCVDKVPGRLMLVVCLVVVGLFITVTSADAVITHVGDIGSASIKDSGVANLVITTTAAVTAGDAIIIAYATDPNQDLTLTVSDAAGNSYQMAAMAVSQGNCRTYIYAAYNVAALASGSTITINQVYRNTEYPVAARAAVASVFRGMASVGALEQTTVASGTSTSPSSGAANTVQADQLLIGVVGTEGPSGDTEGTWSNSFTAGPRAGTTGGTDATTNITVSLGYRIVTTAGSYTAAKTGITSRDWAASIATFKTTTTGISFIGDLGSAQSNTAGTTLAITTPIAVSAGDDIILTIAADPAGAVSSISDGVNTYNQVVDVTNSGNVRTMIYAAYNVSALASGATITITHSSITARAAQAFLFRGLANASVVDQTRTGTGTNASTHSSGATSTTTQASELLIGAAGREGPNMDAPGIWANSFTGRIHIGTSYGSYTGGDTDVSIYASFRIVNATAAYTASIGSFATSRDWAAGIATFKADTGTPTYTLTAGNDGNGAVTLNPTGGTYDSGTTVTLTPVPNSGYVFNSWSGTNSGDVINNGGVYTIVMNGNKAIQANFSQVQYTLTVGNDGNGTVTLNPTGGTYASGSTVTLTPVPNSGYVFSSWGGTNGGNVVNTGGVYTILMNGNKNVTANFSTSASILGSVNGDSEANSTDALIILSCDVGISTAAFCPMNCGDVNGDGLVNSTDALIILSFDAGLSVSFPLEQPGCPTTVTACPGCGS